MRRDDTIIGVKGDIAPTLRLLSAQHEHLLGPHRHTILLTCTLPQQLLQVQEASADDRGVRSDYRILVDMQHRERPQLPKPWWKHQQYVTRDV
jgi:hypothetical protein